MAIFYAPDILKKQVLPEEESQHAVKVLRLNNGDTVEIVDGKGGYYEAVVTLPHQKHCEVEITNTIRQYGKRDYKLHIAIAPTKNIDRLEWFIEKATEIGVDEITPLVCRFSERKIIKPERLEKIIVSASKQSKKAFFPVLNPLCSFSNFIEKHVAEQQFIAHCYNNEKTLLQQVCKKSNEIIVLIGPEGDFSPEEVELALKNNYTPISLGDARLRTETAGVVACATVGIINQY